MKYVIALAIFTLTTVSFSSAQTVRIEVDAGGHDRENCPVVFSLPDSLNDTRSFALVRESDNANIPVQRFGQAKSPRVMWMIHDRLASGEKRTYKLTGNPGRPKRDQTVQCVDDGAKLTVSVSGSPVLKFNHTTVEAPEGIDSIYRRSGYFHPVFTPQGNVVTGDFEKDHAHQHGIFNAWVNATFRDQPVDFWNQAKGKGDVEFTKLQNKRSGPVFAQFTAQMTHVAVREGKRVPAINETWQVRVYNSQKPFLFEVNSRQTLATDDPVIVNEYHYGGFGLRGTSEWLLPKTNKDETTATGKQDDTNQDPVAAGAFMTSEGRTRLEGNHTRARWVELHGPIGSKHAGIIAMGANSNFRAPQTVRLHPTKPYFCFAPMVLGKFSLEPGEVYSLRHRFVVHDGDQDSELAERMWQDLAHPPKARVIE